MNKPVSDQSLRFSQPVRSGSPSLPALFDRIAEGASVRERDRVLPFEQIDLIRQSRLGALRIPVAQGGGGSSIRELFKVVIDLARADSNVTHILRNHFSVVERLLLAPQTEQGRKWQRDVADGAIIGLATTELESTKVGDTIPATVISPDGDGYRLNGTKYYSTGTLFADYVLVRIADTSGRLAATLIPVKREGIELVDDWDGTGQRLTGSGTTNFKNVRVEKDEVVFDAPDTGYGVAYQNTFAQLFLTAVNAGIAAAIARDAAALVRHRGRSFYYAPTERPADDPILQTTIGQISSAAFAAEATVLAAADALDASTRSWASDPLNPEPALQAALAAAKAKVIVDELAVRSGGQLFDVGGASATKRADNLDQHWRNARTLASHNPGTYKARAIGNYDVNGTPLPDRGFF